MSAQTRAPGRKALAPNNLYTVILAFALCLVLATSALVAYKCYFHYDTVFKVP